MKQIISNALSGGNNSNYDIMTDVDSVDAETNLLEKKIQGNKSLQIGGLKHLPTVIFVSFLCIFGVITMKFLFASYHLKESDLYMQKFSLHYFSQFFSQQSTFFKLFTVVSQLTLLIMLYFLTTLIKQRISVPELRDQRWRAYLAGTMGVISVFSVIGLTYYYDSTLEISRKKIGIVNNLMFLVFLYSSFFFSLFSFNILTHIEGNGLKKDKSFLIIKKYVLVLMLLQIVLYTASLCLVSFYKPVSDLEKQLSSALIVNMSFNSIIFVFCFALYIWTMKYDLHYVTLNLQIQPDIEYFLDFEEVAKLTAI